MQYYPFDSRNKLYRNHIGAVASGATLKLRLLLHKDARCIDAFLRIRRDDIKDFEEIHLNPSGEMFDYCSYECEITRETGLYWYDFRYTSEHGTFFVTKTENSLGVVSTEEGSCWQQTVYDAEFTTPSWLAGGIIYQIFPDRFYNSGKAKQDVPEDRFMCSDWRRQPQYRQDGEVDSLGNDYFGGDLVGIRRKLPYLRELGVSCIYLNPIFEAHSNHRYNTANYHKIDPLLGSEDDLKKLCAEAKKLGISVVLDGVFSHTGDDSIYFNKYGRYGEGGAFKDENSPYHSWYKFIDFPEEYNSWWGISTLPETIEEDENYAEFITGKDGVLRRWLRAGISGWRIDVADELPDSFLEKIRTAMKEENPDSYLLGEVWEDATTKISYGARRRFLLGRELDSVMNYPFANAVIDYIKNKNAEALVNSVLDIVENYPPCATALLMNHLGTHDTARAITCLSDAYGEGDRAWQSRQSLSKPQYEVARRRLKAAAVVQYSLPGVPSIFYGDEAGVQGYGDPFCRATYPWGSGDNELLDFYRALGAVRRGNKAFCYGDFVPVKAEGGVLAFLRRGGASVAFTAVNVSDQRVEIKLPDEVSIRYSAFGKKPYKGVLELESGEYSIITV